MGRLGSEYESVVVNLTRRSYDLTLPKIQFALQSYEMRLEVINAVNIADPLSAPMANLVIQGGRGNNGRRGCRRGRGKLGGHN